eukprot:m.357838 g.357838  ORF g.357838 m.357838 type:complete len:86 (-) comp17957_c0_seq1:1730-1987(-)
MAKLSQVGHFLVANRRGASRSGSNEAIDEGMRECAMGECTNVLHAQDMTFNQNRTSCQAKLLKPFNNTQQNKSASAQAAAHVFSA